LSQLKKKRKKRRELLSFLTLMHIIIKEEGKGLSDVLGKRKNGKKEFR